MKEFIQTLYRITLKVTHVFFWIFSAIMIGIILVMDMQLSDKLTFLGFTLLGLGMSYAIIRFLRYIFDK